MIALERVALRFDVGGRYREVKDPCPVLYGSRWHLFGTGVCDDHFELLHATADRIEGPWRTLPPVLDSGGAPAPGAVAEDGLLHLFVQTEYNRLGGRLEHLVSTDDGTSFGLADIALESLPDGDEAGVYDAHPAEIGGEKYLVYSAFSVVGEPDIHLARTQSGTWDGPWLRLGRVLGHDDVTFHNQRGVADYEWGLEGGQLVELPDGSVLLNAVCFLSDGSRGCRQRIFFATAPGVDGPFETRGPLVVPRAGRQELGENGHATAIVVDGRLTLFFQERDGSRARWRYGLARSGALTSAEPAEDAA